MFEALIALAFLLLLAAASTRRVPEGQAWVVHRFGRYARTLRPGWNPLAPLVERVTQRVNLINHRVDLPLRSGFDPRTTAQRATIYYQILEPERSGAQLADIDNVVAAVAREQACALTQAGRELDAAAERLKPLLNLQLGGMGLRVIRCQMPGA